MSHSEHPKAPVGAWICEHCGKEINVHEVVHDVPAEDLSERTCFTEAGRVWPGVYCPQLDH